MEGKERLVIYEGKPARLAGPEIKAGQKAPDFKLVSVDMKEVRLADSQGKVRFLSVVHSLDTPVCDHQTIHFNEEAGRLKDAVIYTISMDLPFAQARYFSDRNIENMKAISDYREASFGLTYGVLMPELRLLSRAVFIIDRDDTVRYVEYLKDVGQPPDIDRAIAALKQVVAGEPVRV